MLIRRIKTTVIKKFPITFSFLLATFIYIFTLIYKRIHSGSKEFTPALSSERLNHLFGILESKEQTLSNTLNRLNVINFHDLIKSNLSINVGDIQIQELNSKLHVINFVNLNYSKFTHLTSIISQKINDQNHLQVREEFVQELIKTSSQISFGTKQLTSLSLKSELESKPVVVTAGNERYFVPLLRVIKNIKTYFTDNKIILYDLGIQKKNLKTVRYFFSFVFSVEIRIV